MGNLKKKKNLNAGGKKTNLHLCACCAGSESNVIYFQDCAHIPEYTAMVYVMCVGVKSGRTSHDLTRSSFNLLIYNLFIEYCVHMIYILACVK